MITKSGGEFRSTQILYYNIFFSRKATISFFFKGNSFHWSLVLKGKNVSSNFRD